MSLKLSLSLSALLTAILLPVAILRARQSVLFSAMTLAMLGMMWRAEAWKTVYLQSERQLLEQRQPQRPPISPKTEFFYQHQSSACDDLGWLCLGFYSLPHPSTSDAADVQKPSLGNRCGWGISLAYRRGRHRSYFDSLANQPCHLAIPKGKGVKQEIIALHSLYPQGLAHRSCVLRLVIHHVDP